MRTHNPSLRWLGALALAFVVTADCRAQQPPASLAVFPPEVNLFTSRSRQVFVVQAVYADGLTRDVTAETKATLVNPAFAKLDKNVLTPVADGATEMKVEFGGKAVNVPVKVKDAKVERPISFKLDVMPIFMRSGCNQGGCHGAARGKDGFRLSLFGFDPDGDHYRLTREMSGRRINLALPAESLLLEKVQGKVPHTGGQQIKEGDEYTQNILRWLEAGAPLDPPTVPTPIGVELYPQERCPRRQGRPRSRWSCGPSTPTAPTAT